MIVRLTQPRLRPVSCLLVAVAMTASGCGGDDGDQDPADDAEGDVAVDTAGPPVDTTFVPPDVDETPPNVSLGEQAIAGICAKDSDCQSGYCNTYHPGGYCTQPCGGDNPECGEGSVCLYTEDSNGAKANLCLRSCTVTTQCRLDQFCATQAGVCTPRCQPGSCNAGFECDLIYGICQPEGPCEPAPEACNNLDDDCDGYIDNGCGPTPGSAPHVRVIDMGKATVGGGGLSRSFSFTPTPGAASFTIIALADNGREYYMGAYGVIGPDGVDLMGSGSPYDAPNRSFPSFDVFTVQVPNTDAVALQEGRYRFTFVRYPTEPGEVVPLGNVWVYVLENQRQEPFLSSMTANFWFVKTPGLTAASAPGDAKFQTLVTKFKQVMTNQGVDVAAINYYDVTGADADRFTILDTTDGDIDEHSELLAYSAALGNDDPGVNFFFVQGFTGWQLLGKAGGIPGPAFVNGTYSSGVAVSLSEYFTIDDDNLATNLTAETMAHELGHQLGLYHTTESDGTAFDHILDTPECPAAQYDSNGDGFVDPQECLPRGGTNLMFWTPSLVTQLSVGQRFVIHRNPVLE